MRTSIIMSFLGVLFFECNHNSVTPAPSPEPGPVPSPAANTAAYKLEDVDSLAESYAKGLRLMSLGSQNVNFDGTSNKWCYQYVDTSMPPTSYWFHADSSTVKIDSTCATGVGSGFIGTKWFNSDSALSIAERNGGSQFRAENAHYTIVASVGTPVVPNPKTYWYVTYRSTDNQTKLLALRVDASSGEVIVMNN